MTNHTRAIATSTLWQIGSQAIMAILSIVTVKFVALGLSKELAGYYNSAYGFLQIFAILADFGLYAVSVREVSKAENKEKIFGTLFFLRFLITVISLGAAVIFVWLLPQWRGTPFPLGVAIASLVPFFTLLAGMIRVVFQTEYKMHFVFVAEVLQRILTTVGIGLFLLWGVRQTSDVGVYAWFLGLGSIGAALLFLVSFFYGSRLMPIRFHIDRKLLKKMLVLAAPYGFAYLLLTMYRQLDVAFIAILRPDFAIQNAYYGFAGRVEDLAFLVPTLLLNSLLPILSKRIADKTDVGALLGKTFLILLVLGSIFFLYAFLWARPLTLLFATPDYLGTALHAGSDTAFRFMSLPMFLNGLVLFSFYVFLARHEWVRLIAAFGVSVVLTFVLNLLWTPAYGFPGAAAALIVVHIALAAYLVPLTFRTVSVRLKRDDVLRWLGFSVILGLLLWTTEPVLQTALASAIAGAASLPLLGILLMSCGLHRTLALPGAKGDMASTVA